MKVHFFFLQAVHTHTHTQDFILSHGLVDTVEERADRKLKPEGLFSIFMWGFIMHVIVAPLTTVISLPAVCR